MEQTVNNLINSIISLNLSALENIMLIYDKIKEYSQNGLYDNKTITKLFNNCMLKMGYNSCIIESMLNGDEHMHVITNVNDDKYDVHGIYHFDISLDCFSKQEDDRICSYSFFCRNTKEMKTENQRRIMKGASAVIMGDESIAACRSENPFRTLEIVSGFYSYEDIDRDIKFINEYREDIETKPSYWPMINKNYELCISSIRDKANHSPEILTSVIEELIANVQKIKNKSLSNEQLKQNLQLIKEYNNKRFKEFFSDTRLLFELKPQNYVSKDEYKSVLNDAILIYNSKKENNQIKTVIEFTNNQQQQVLFKIIVLSGEEEKVIMNYTFDNSYDFSELFLNPLIQMYSEYFSYMTGIIEKPKYFNLKIRSYACESNSGDFLMIKNGRIEYLEKVDYFLKNNSQKIDQQNKDEESKLK